MFTWLQTHIQKHHKVVFGVLLVLIIIAFVFTIGNFGGFGGGANQQTVRREYYGFNLNSSRDRGALSDWTRLTFLLEGRYPSQDAMEADMMQRAPLLFIAGQLEIPEPTEEQFKEYVSQRPAFIDRATGQFSQNAYTEVLDQFENNPNISEETLVTTLTQNYRIDQVRKLLGGPGYVLPYQAMQELKRRETVWTADVATLDEETFRPSITATQEQLQEYYEQNKASYETEPMLVASYVEIKAADLVDKVAEPDETQLLMFYNRNRAKWPKNDEGVTKQLADIKDEVLAAYKLDQAKSLALNEANNLAFAIYDAVYQKSIRLGDDSIPTFFSEQEYSLVDLPPFSQSSPPTPSPFAPDALESVFSLDDNRFYSDGIPTNDGAAIVILKETSGTTIPPLADVKVQVLADYTEVEKKIRYNERGQELTDELQTAVNDGKSFVETAESLGLTVRSAADFTLIDSQSGLDRFELDVLSSMDQGEVINLRKYSDPGTIIFAAKKEVPEVSVDSDEVVKEVEQLAQYSSRATEFSILNELVAIGVEQFNQPDDLSEEEEL
ncbi:MAG: peptidyl-prolyl cis-trans isomerase [Verrucomicrobiota bacterium]